MIWISQSLNSCSSNHSKHKTRKCGIHQRLYHLPSRFRLRNNQNGRVREPNGYHNHSHPSVHQRDTRDLSFCVAPWKDGQINTVDADTWVEKNESSNEATKSHKTIPDWNARWVCGSPELDDYSDEEEKKVVFENVIWEQGAGKNSLQDNAEQVDDKSSIQRRCIES